MISFSRSTDYKLVRRLLTHPWCYRRMANDRAPERGKFQVKPRPDLEYVVASDQAGPLAVFLVIDCGETAELHFCFAPRAWGMTETVSREFLRWLWRKTRFTRLLGPVPGYNRLALRLARKVGFLPQTVVPGAVRKYDKPHDLIVLEMKRPTSC